MTSHLWTLEINKNSPQTSHCSSRPLYYTHIAIYKCQSNYSCSFVAELAHFPPTATVSAKQKVHFMGVLEWICRLCRHLLLAIPMVSWQLCHKLFFLCKGPLTIINVLKFWFLFQIFGTHPQFRSGKYWCDWPQIQVKTRKFTDLLNNRNTILNSTCVACLSGEDVLKPFYASSIFKTTPNNWQEPKTMRPKGFGVENWISIFNILCSTTHPHFRMKIEMLKHWSLWMAPYSINYVVCTLHSVMSKWPKESNFRAVKHTEVSSFVCFFFYTAMPWKWGEECCHA